MPYDEISKLAQEMTERRLSVAGQQDTVLWFPLFFTSFLHLC